MPMRKTKSRRYSKTRKYGGKTLKKPKQKKSKGKKSFVDIGATRPRNTGAAGMSQNIEVTKQLANSMAQSRSRAQGLAQSLARGMGQSLA